MYRQLTPISKILAIDQWPVDFFRNDALQNLLDSAYVVDFQSSANSQSLAASITLIFEGEVAFDIPGLSGVSIVGGIPEVQLPPPPIDEPPPDEESLGGPPSDFPYDTNLLEGWTQLSLGFNLTITNGNWSISIYDLSFELRFESSILKPIDGSEFVAIGMRGDLSLDQALNVSFKGFDEFDLAPCEIGNTGLILSAQGVKLDLSRQSSPGEIIAAGFDESFIGLFLQSASIQLPESLTQDSGNPIVLELRNAVIGDGGISGVVSITAPLSAKLSGFQLELTEGSLEFRQNAIISSSLAGILQVPFFDEPLTIALSLTSGGGFHASLGQADEDGLLELPIPGLGILTLSSIGFVDDEQGTAIVLSGILKLTVLSPPQQWPEIELQDLRIDASGNVQLPNGWIDLQEPAGFSLFGFGFEMTRIGFGNMEDGRRWVGFSGGVQLLPSLPTGVSVEGLRIIWNPEDPDEPPQITLQGVGVELTLPGVLQFDGDVAFITEGEERYFKGNASLDIIPIGISIDASVKIGRNLEPDYRYMYTFMDLTLPIGIPLFATGTAFYGFSGLYGMNIGPSAQKSDWYGWYAGPPEEFNVTNSGKWIGENDGKALGAGLTIGTLFDTGRVVSAKGLFALILPGPVIILHGMANFLSTPPDVNEPTSQGVFNMLAVLDMLAGSIQLNIDAGWSKANVLDIAASAEAYFDFGNPRNWHFYLGKDEPADRRIRAYILSLFQADAYLMIDRNGIATGASISWGIDWKFGPVKVVLRSWIGGDAAITWQPNQLEGRLYVGGEFEISVAGFGVGIGAEAELSGTTPTAYCVRGTLYLRVKLPTPIKDLEEDILLEWKEVVIPPFDDPFRSIGVEHMKVDETWTKLPPYRLQDRDPGDEGYDPGPIVPLDARPSVVFDRPMKDETTEIELNNPDGYDSGYESTNIDGYLFDYELKEVKLEKWSKAGGTKWVAVEDLYGTCMATEDANGEVAASKFQLWTKSPFAFTRQSSRTYTDNFLANHPLWPCTKAEELTTHCVDWEDLDTDTVSTFPQSFEWMNLHFTAVLSDFVDVVNAPISSCGTKQALRLPESINVLWIVFPESVRNVEICIGRDFVAVKAFANGVALEQILNPNAGNLTLESTGIDVIALWSVGDGSEVARICYQIESEVAAHDSTQEYMDRVVASLKRWDSTEEILEPETWYRLTVNHETVRTHNGVAERDPISHYAYFQTAGPPGLTPAWALNGASGDTSDNVTLPYPQGGKLTDLQQYLSWTIPGDGDQPVYRAYDLGADFNENYVEQMYGADMAIRLLDGNGKPVTDAEGNEVIFPNLWAKQPTGELSETEIAYTTRIEDCLELPSMPVLGDQKILFANVVLLEEDFSGDLDQWTDPNSEEASDWIIGGGMLIYDGTTFPTLGALLVAGEGEWTDYALEVALSSQGEEIGLVFRYTSADTASYYRLRLKAAERLLEKVIDGEITVLWQDNTGYTPGDSKVLGVQCQGDHLRGQLDDELLFDLRDDAPLLSGQVGIYTNSTAGFEHFLVREWPGGVLAPKTMYRAELMASFVLFTGGLSAGWTDDAFKWVELKKDNARIASIGREDWDNYRVEVNMDSSKGHVGAIVRFQQHPEDGTFACYRLIINSNAQILTLARLEGTYSDSDGTYEIPESGRTELWSCEGLPAISIFIFIRTTLR